VRCLIGGLAALVIALGAAPVASADKYTFGDLTVTDEQDDAFTAKLTELKIPIPEGDMPLAGWNSCLMLMDENEGLIGAGAYVADVWSLTGKQASTVVDTAIDVYCPEAES
jgi:hypothetical protein